jgi:hypothetical protein
MGHSATITGKSGSPCSRFLSRDKISRCTTFVLFSCWWCSQSRSADNVCDTCRTPVLFCGGRCARGTAPVTLQDKAMGAAPDGEEALPLAQGAPDNRRSPPVSTWSTPPCCLMAAHGSSQRRWRTGRSLVQLLLGSRQRRYRHSVLPHRADLRDGTMARRKLGSDWDFLMGYETFPGVSSPEAPGRTVVRRDKLSRLLRAPRAGVPQPVMQRGQNRQLVCCHAGRLARVPGGPPKRRSDV